MADTELKQHVYAQRQDRAQAPVLTRNISISEFKFKVHKRKAGDVWTSRSGTEGGQEVFSQPSVTCQGFPVAHNIGLYTSEHGMNMALQQETTLTIQDSWWLRPLLVARRNEELLFLFCICVRFCPLEGKWQNNSERLTSQADWWADWFRCIIY